MHHISWYLKSVIVSNRNTVTEFHNNCSTIILEIAKMTSNNETKSCTNTSKRKSKQYYTVYSFIGPVNRIWDTI